MAVVDQVDVQLESLVYQNLSENLSSSGHLEGLEKPPEIWPVGLAGPIHVLKKNVPILFCFLHIFTTWWLNQPMWKICGSQFGSFPPVGVKIRNV